MNGWRLRLSAQRALLGAICIEVLAISVWTSGSKLKMLAYADSMVSDDCREALSVALTEILADFADTLSVVDLKIVENATPPIKISGELVFLRHGCQVEQMP